ncbi:hypothetical protein CF645_06180 [Burkholderia pseudomallei]|nr:hypothetical protein CF640_08880 [Burkholderia pseudomallei]PNX09852.1 hypothetical protein CF641_02690 [Burkholderia pseudomallei]PNX18148.1 hypothetical protein CF650_02040 [Burkholderia sp. 129]PNX23444.1 hypothetical protein CF645_06180 [Burkholderia pseudomallei]PNX45042.1 hypothetical protein CF642_00905 [Burkholderia pseudomallei]
MRRATFAEILSDPDLRRADTEKTGCSPSFFV